MVSVSRRKTGDTGEVIALQYLQSKGCTIETTNYTIHGGEIDIIARDPACENQTVFIEVRYRQSDAHGHPLDTLTKKKKHSLLRTARMYANLHAIDLDRCRFDFIAIMPLRAGHRIWHVRKIDMIG